MIIFKKALSLKIHSSKVLAYWTVSMASPTMYLCRWLLLHAKEANEMLSST